MSTTALWIAIVACSAGCYALKLTGLSVPPSFLERPLVERISALLPIALLAALVAVGTVGVGQGLTIDARVAGVGAAAIALLLRAPFLLVVVIAAAVAALVRALSG